MTVENISWSISTKECCRPRRGLNPRPPGLQSDGASNWATEAGGYLLESPHWGDSNRFPKHMFSEEIRKKNKSFLAYNCSLRILYNSKFIFMATSFGGKCCRCNEGSLYKENTFWIYRQTQKALVILRGWASSAGLSLLSFGIRHLFVRRAACIMYMIFINTSRSKLQCIDSFFYLTFSLLSSCGPNKCGPSWEIQ